MLDPGASCNWLCVSTAFWAVAVKYYAINLQRWEDLVARCECSVPLGMKIDASGGQKSSDE